MTEETKAAGSGSTVACDYDTCYYATHLGGEEGYDWSSESWRNFFGLVADRLIAVTAPSSVLDVGCAKGLLVQALAERGIDARGFDVSEHAIETAHPDIRERLSVRSATDPIDGTYDLITCIEVLEHMSDSEAQQAIDRMTAATSRILFSSSPSDFAEPTHINVHDNAAWSAWFADRGFFRRTDVDVSFLTPWAILFERSDSRSRDLVHRYEALLNPMKSELLEKRQALLESFREVSRLSQEVTRLAEEKVPEPGIDPDLVKKWEAEVLEARHRLLVNRDHFIGVEAEVGRLRRDLARAASQLAAGQRRLKRVTARREELKERLDGSRERLQASQQRIKRLTARIETLEAELATARTRTSFARKVAKRVRGAMR